MCDLASSSGYRRRWRRYGVEDVIHIWKPSHLFFFLFLFSHMPVSLASVWSVSGVSPFRPCRFHRRYHCLVYNTTRPWQWLHAPAKSLLLSQHFGKPWPVPETCLSNSIGTRCNRRNTVSTMMPPNTIPGVIPTLAVFDTLSYWKAFLPLVCGTRYGTCHRKDVLLHFGPLSRTRAGIVSMFARWHNQGFVISTLCYQYLSFNSSPIFAVVS